MSIVKRWYEISCIWTEGERFNARQSSSYLRRNLTVVFMYHRTSSRFSFDRMCLSPFLFLYWRFFSNFSFCLDDGWQKKRDGFFPFDWGYRQKSDLTVLEKLLYLSDHPSPPPAKVRWLRFGLRQLSIIEGLLDDLLISVCDMNAEQDNDEDAVLVHRLLYGCEKRRAFSKCRWIQRGTGIREGNWSQKASRKCFWDCYWGRACQLLVNYFPYNSTRSLCERTEDRGFWNLQLMKRAWSTLRRGCDRQALFFQHRNICWFIFIWQELKQLRFDSREWCNNALIV